MTTDPYQEALGEILAAYDRSWKEAAELGAALCKRKGVKEGFAPLARLFKHPTSRELVVQRCLEQDEEHPLHAAVRGLALAGRLPTSPWLPIHRGPLPKRWTVRLVASRREPVVYAIESDARVSVWSLESGEHVADLALPCGKKGRAVAMAELDDGTLRALGSDGSIAERAPGAKGFARVLASSELRWGWVASPELRWLVRQLDFQPVEVEGGREQRIGIFDAVTRGVREVRVPIDYPEGFVWTTWGGGRAVFGGRRSIEIGPDVWRDENSLVVLDPASGSFEAIPLAAEVRQVAAAPEPGVLHLSLCHRDPEGGEERYEEASFDLSTRALGPAPAASEDESGWSVPMRDGLRFNLHRGWVVDARGETVGGYAMADDPYRKIALWDAARGQLVLAGGDPATPVQIVRPYDPRAGREASARPAKAEPPAPLPWARPGVVLRYAIADFDAADEYSFAVVEAGEGLTLEIRMGAAGEAGSEVAARARFSAAALESASKAVAIAQGGADVDLSKEQGKLVPPIVISRAGAAKLRAGKGLAWKSEWSEPTTLEEASAGVGSVQVDGAERAVATLSASAEGVSLTVLDDPRWPLVIERVEADDCHVRLCGIEMGGAGEVSASEGGTAAGEGGPSARAGKKGRATGAGAGTGAAAGAGAAAASGGARRFEAREGEGGKFWEVAAEGAALTVRFGKIGAAGAVQTKALASAEAATKEMERLIREKTKKGYVAV